MTIRFTKATRRTICTMANKMRKTGLTLSEAFRKAWDFVKRGFSFRAAGTTFDGRQNILEYLSSFRTDDLRLALYRDRANTYDPNALKVAVQIPAQGIQAFCGYVPRQIAAVLAPVFGCGVKLSARCRVIGGFGQFSNFGLLVQLSF